MKNAPSGQPLLLRSLTEVPPVAMRAGRVALDATTRADLLEAVKTGREVELEMDIVAFVQDEAPNKNHVRLTAAAARKIARSLNGKPFIRDHAHGELNAVGGEIVKSEWDGAGGLGRIMQTVRLTYPWAVEHALRGGLKRFSIAWTSNERPTCSIDGKNMGWLDGCGHSPGDEVTLKDGSKKRAEAVFSDGDGIETSGVLIPATQTSLETVRVALGFDANQQHRAHQERPMKLVCQKLGLVDDANEATILGAIDKLRLDRDATQALHAAELEAHKATSATLAAANVELGKVRAADRDKTLASVRDTIERKLGKGERSKPAIDVALQLADVSLEKAQEFAEKLTAIIPIGQPLQSRGTEPGERVGELTAQQKKIAKALGVAEADYLKTLQAQREEEVA